MVSTPIGVPLPNSPEKNSQIPYPQYPNQSNDIISSQYTNQTHSFPVLYTNSPIRMNTTEVSSSPSSLYNQYMNNPYNPIHTNNQFSIYGTNPLLVYQQQTVEQTVENVPVTNSIEISNENTVCSENENTELNVTTQVATNIFQSSNYFYMNPNAENIPVGSEILFGTTNNKTT